MIRVTNYDKELLFFECGCGCITVKDISDKITDDCVFKVECTCEICGDVGSVYYLHNVTEDMSKELLAEFKALKIK